MNRKIYAIAASLALAFSMTSCEEDDDEKNYVSPDVLTGRWVLSEVGTLNSVGALNYVSALDNCAEDEITLQANTFSSVVTTPLPVEGCQVETAAGSWELVNGNLEFATETNEEFRRDIYSLTPTTMVLVYTNADGLIEFLKYQKGI